MGSGNQQNFSTSHEKSGTHPEEKRKAAVKKTGLTCLFACDPRGGLHLMDRLRDRAVDLSLAF